MAFADITTAIKRHTNAFRRDTRGNLTMIAGLSAIPVIAAAGMAIDYARISRVHDEMQLIADGATLAAASARNLTGTSDQRKTQRIAIATNYMTDGLARLTDVDTVGTPSVTATDSNVSIFVQATVKGSFMNVLNAVEGDADLGSGGAGNTAGTGGKRYGIRINSQASWNDGASLLCLLVLNGSDSKSLEIQGTADIDAPDCAVWVNSTSNSALYENGNATLYAKKICAVGGYVGTAYYPDKPKTNASHPAFCKNYPDPLAAKFESDYNDSYTATTPVRYNGYNSSSKKYVQATYSGSGTTELWPGIYKGGIQVKAGHKVLLRPGIYFIQNGQFEVQQGIVENYDFGSEGGVTIVLTEPDAKTKVTNNSATRLYITAQSTVNIKAPSTGLFAGIAIAQHKNSIPPANKNDANKVIGGGTKEIVGIVYYPTQYLYITGGGSGTVANPERISTTSKQFAIVADKVFVEGNGQLKLGGAANSEAAGLPALPSAGAGQTIISLK